MENYQKNVKNLKKICSKNARINCVRNLSFCVIILSLYTSFYFLWIIKIFKGKIYNNYFFLKKTGKIFS